MYSQEIEELIDIITENGVYTERERNILHRRATAEGIDVDEIDFIVSSRIAKKNKIPQSPKPQATPTVPPPVGVQMVSPAASSHNTRIRTCPSCGNLVGPSEKRCRECGFTMIDNTPSIYHEKLINKIDQIRRKYENRKKNLFKSLISKDPMVVELEDAIRSFPTPSVREDLLDFMLYLNSLIENGDYESEVMEAYEDKYNECCAKAKILFPGDSQINIIIQNNLT